MIEGITYFHPLPSRKAGIRSVVLSHGAYFVWVLYCGYFQGTWIYPFPSNDGLTFEGRFLVLSNLVYLSECISYSKNGTNSSGPPSWKKTRGVRFLTHAGFKELTVIFKNHRKLNGTKLFVTVSIFLTILPCFFLRSRISPPYDFDGQQYKWRRNTVFIVKHCLEEKGKEMYTVKQACGHNCYYWSIVFVMQKFSSEYLLWDNSQKETDISFLKEEKEWKNPNLNWKISVKYKVN